jgi:Ketopantoate reductase PanE/ApbA
VHVAVVGAGALGIVYGTLLASVGVEVTFVVRPARAADRQPFVVERVDGDQTRHTCEAPRRASAVPTDADVILVCVRAEQLDDALVALLAPGQALQGPACVFLAPMFPSDIAFLRAVLGDRVVPAMPSAVAYTATSGAVRCWLPSVAVTLVEGMAKEAKPPRAPLDALVKSLNEAGITSRIEIGVYETNFATTVTFVPLALGIHQAGGIDPLMEDAQLLDDVLRAVDEASALARTIGKPAGWCDTFMKFTAPFTLKLGLGLARRRAPEAVSYVEEHFVKKLHAQSVRMAEGMVELAREKAVAHAALEQLLGRLR